MAPLKPWLVRNDRGDLLCLCCPVDRTDRRGMRYYLGIGERVGRKERAKFLRIHRRCGFD